MMIPVAKAKGITIHSPPNGIIGFHTSPYPMHVQGGAVDIFVDINFGSPAQSPVSGEVTIINKNKVGIARHFQADPYDYILVIKTENACIRMLHVEPEIEVGEEVEIGDRIGRYLRSPLLPFWSYPHIHTEIKDCSDPLTPLNAFPLEWLGKGHYQGSPARDFDGFEGIVQSATKDYLIVRPTIDILGAIGTYQGVAVEVGDEYGLLDAQAPWNCYGGVALPEDLNVELGQEVKLGAVPLGKIVRKRKGMATYALGEELGEGLDRYSKGLLLKDIGRFNVPYKRIKVNGEVFLGLSTALSLDETRTIKLIPPNPISNIFEIGEKVIIELEFN